MVLHVVDDADQRMRLDRLCLPSSNLLELLARLIQATLLKVSARQQFVSHRVGRIDRDDCPEPAFCSCEITRL